MNLKNNNLSERSQSQKYMILYRSNIRTGKSIETEYRLVVARGSWGVTANGYQVSV